MSHAILIVDDAADWRATLAGLLRDVYPDLQVMTAASLQEAKTQLDEYHFDLAVIDIRLDESDEDNTEGLELMEFIFQHHPGTPSLIITGYANLDTVRRAMQPDETGARRAADYIEKDKIHSELLPRVSDILARRREGM
jgi:DNA-binding NtrC family response regulator